MFPEEMGRCVFASCTDGNRGLQGWNAQTWDSYALLCVALEMYRKTP